MKPYATLEGTKKYKERLKLAENHFRLEQNLCLSSIGVGTYLGDENEATDLGYAQALETALLSGCNFLDTAINYRHQRSERVIGRVIKKLIKEKKISRDEIVVATKGGFIPFDNEVPINPQKYLQNTFVAKGVMQAKDIVAGCHVMTPHYLEHEIIHSLKNLELDCIDIYYVHNPETQFEKLSKDQFYSQIWNIFEMLEGQVSLGHIRNYDIATWNAFRLEENSREYIQLSKLLEIAHEVGGENHHFRFIQLPFNLAMPEALTVRNQKINNNSHSILESAKALGISLVTSASIMQGQLSQNFPAQLREKFQGLETDAQRALQFVRSTPGVTSALVGMSQAKHAEENLKVATVNPIDDSQYRKLFLN